jgi:hypothetical protein
MTVVLGQEHRHMLSEKPSYIDQFFSRLLQLLEPELFYSTSVSAAFGQVRLLFNN